MKTLQKSKDQTSPKPRDESLPDRIYYGAKRGYAIEHNGTYIPLCHASDVKSHLLAAGFLNSGEVLAQIQLKNYVAYLGPVAGNPPGPQNSTDNGCRFLVTQGPKLIKGKSGPFPFIGKFIKELFGPDPQQIEAATSWVRQARANVIAGKRRPLPVAALVGPRCCGKTLFIELVRHLIGGRSAKAYASLNGKTRFNEEIIGSELLVIDDEQSGKDHHSRTTFAQGIKRDFFASSVRIEGKNKDVVALRPVHALIIAVNNEPEHVEVLPVIDDSMKDKISLFECGQATFDGLEREQIWEKIEEEAPHFVHYLETSKHPEHLRDKRTGAAAWQNPSVINLLTEISVEGQFHELLTQCTKLVHTIEHEGCWEGTASELESLLREDHDTKLNTERIAKHAKAVGTYLGKLESGRRIEVDRRTINGTTRWRITRLCVESNLGGLVDHHSNLSNEKQL